MQSLDNADFSIVNAQKSIGEDIYQQKYSVEKSMCIGENRKWMQTIEKCGKDNDIAIAITKLHAILEAVSDRVEMHTNMGKQHDNWNSLRLNSINMITLTDKTMAGLGAISWVAMPVFTLKLSSCLLFFAATRMLLVINKFQPPQLVEEQRNASRLFKQIRKEIETLLAFDHQHPNQADVNNMMERVLALDKAYPLPLIGVMLEKKRHGSINTIAMQSLDDADFSVVDAQKSTGEDIYQQKYSVEKSMCIGENRKWMQTIEKCGKDNDIAIAKLHAILEAVSDRVEMHTNMGEQRDNWNSLLLNSINMITLTGTTMAGLGTISGVAMPVFALKLSSCLLFSAATGMLMVMNKLQPSQLVEEQRNASRLFKQIRKEIETLLAFDHQHLNQTDVNNMMERVLALDKAYPLPLIGVMLEKFPAKLKPTVWWPPLNVQFQRESRLQDQERHCNGWTDEIENEMREIVEVLKRKDKEDYIRLGNIALKLNKIFAIMGPILSGMAAIGSAFVGSSSLAIYIAVGAGALATIVNSLEHGGQIGMVFEMYRNSAGFYQLLEESIESTLEGGELERRENGEIYATKVALQLGRSLKQLKELATASASSRKNGETIQEFASKLF
ncbi:unnamed protein product [Fraxinus pennsylvanica]|uniref:F-box protein n=1 Tax=Fraxinus pennsylvanica TaxID=56036 RepID=A0AAD2E9L9_9LAMI|nr:unnamed protein product [Fraxinus pennsylvanica]